MSGFLKFIDLSTIADLFINTTHVTCFSIIPSDEVRLHIDVKIVNFLHAQFKRSLNN